VELVLACKEGLIFGIVDESTLKDFPRGVAIAD
jgi:hypothetical protein